MSRSYRLPPSDTDLRHDPGALSPADRHPHSADFYRPLRESSLPYSSSRGPETQQDDVLRPLRESSLPYSSSRGPEAQQDGVLSILSSCGLEPADLALLAELPEDVLTVESLPHILKQIKGKRGTVKPFSHSSSSSSSSASYPHSSAQQPSSSTHSWDQYRSQPVRYPLDIRPSLLPSEHDCRGNPRVRADPRPSSSSPGCMGDFPHRPKSGKPGPSFSPVKQGTASRFSGVDRASYSAAPPSAEQRPKGGADRHSGSSSISRCQTTSAVPSKKQALDFYGTPPATFPHSCSLCDITVLSERVWSQHVNSTQHANGQLSLLQRCPQWDCHMETVSRDNNQPETWIDEGKSAQPPQTANQKQTSQVNRNLQKKPAVKGKVVCVKFPAQSVDEMYLRKLMEPFGKIVRILMFPSLAFVELGSVNQAVDLVKFHINYPPTVNGEPIEFSISKTFSFLQSSQVLSFSPAPSGGDGQSDLISIVKRFGQPLYTLFLPSVVFVEMKNSADAQKMVDYYSSNVLRINSTSIKVSYSAEYKSLVRVSAAKKYEEEPGPTRTTSSKDGSRSRSRDNREKRTKSRSRSRSRDRDNREKRTKSRSISRSRSREEDKLTQTSHKETRARSNSRSREKVVEPEKPEDDSKPAEEEERQEEADSPAEDSDIEGMEVIAEDGQQLEDDEEDEETKEQDKSEEEEEETENQEETVEEEEELEEEEEGAASPLDLENCITLDELDEDESSERGKQEVTAAEQPVFAAESNSDSREGRGRAGGTSSKETAETVGSSPERETLKRKDCGPQKTQSEPEPADLLKSSETDQQRDEEEKTSEAEVKDPDPSRDPPEQDCEAAAEEQCEPAGGATVAPRPTEPVGTEFVQPVVGYFCHLCQLIFTDEDEAKQQHCSSPAHISRYQEKVGKDLWTS